MEYLRNAASAVLAKSSSPLQHYVVGPPVTHTHRSSSSSPTIWKVHEGSSKQDGSPCTVFYFDVAHDNNSGRSKLVIARNALRKLRTMRHPDVLKLLDSAETPTAVYIAVEPVRQLQPVLDDWIRNGGTAEGKQEWIAWGLSRIAKALKFINVDASSIHGNIRPESIFLSQAGEWRLGGFELLSAKADSEAVLWNFAGLVPDSTMWAPPEIRQGGWTSLRDGDYGHLVDTYAFGLLAFAAYNGLVPTANTSMPPQGSVPAPLFSQLRRMLNPNVKSRMPVAELAGSNVWDGNRLADLSDRFENFMLASERERNDAIRLLQASSSSLPSDFLTHRILPSLVNALNLSYQSNAAGAQGAANGISLSNNVHAATILPLVLQLGASLPAQQWTSSVLPPILKAYASPDRSVRITLLDALPSYIDRIDAKRVSDAMWPNVLTGFADSSAAIREGTLKAILPLSPKLTDRIRNNDLLRQLAKTQVDVEPSIRTNTTILLGRLAPNLQVSTRKSVLIPAFSRSLKDPFVHARVAGLMALMATSDSYDRDDLAKSVLPVVCPVLVDKEKTVRDQADKAVDMFMNRVKKEAQDMPETMLPPQTTDSHQVTGSNGATSFEGGKGLSGASGAPAAGGYASTAGGAASALAGWAMTGAMNYFADGAAPPAPASSISMAAGGTSSAAGSMDNKRPPLLTGSSGTATPPTTRNTEDWSWDAPSSSSPSSAVPTSSGSNLIDMEDDTADWSAFESAAGPASRKKTAGSSSMPPRTSSALSRTASSSSASSTTAATRKLNLGTRPSANLASPRKEMSSTGTERLKMVSAAANDDDAAWGQDDWGSMKASTPANSSPMRPTVSSQSTASASAAAAAFATPVPSWGTPTTETPPKVTPTAAATKTTTTTTWSNDFDDDDDNETPAATAAAASAAPVSKEDKKAQMERQREERRERMRKLKESKGKKLGDSLA